MPELTLGEAAEDVVSRIQSMGVRLDVNSRFSRMATTLEKGFIGPDDPDFLVAVESTRDVRVMHLALSELMGKVPEDVLREKVQSAIKDESLPQDGSDRSPGRDAQCELHVAGVCARAGMRPELKEPDICCYVKDSPYAIAVKRVKSEAQFEKRFRNAASQVDNAGVKGFIVMDMSIAFNAENAPLVSDDNIREMQVAHRVKMKAFVDALHASMKEWLRGREVRGLLIIDHIIKHEPARKDWPLETFNYFVPFTQHNQRRHREFNAFQEKYSRGTVNPHPRN